jgi:hypothetical protein
MPIDLTKEKQEQNCITATGYATPRHAISPKLSRSNAINYNVEQLLMIIDHLPKRDEAVLPGLSSNPAMTTFFFLQYSSVAHGSDAFTTTFSPDTTTPAGSPKRRLPPATPLLVALALAPAATPSRARTKRAPYRHEHRKTTAVTRPRSTITPSVVAAVHSPPAPHGGSVLLSSRQ